LHSSVFFWAVGFSFLVVGFGVVAFVFAGEARFD